MKCHIRRQEIIEAMRREHLWSDPVSEVEAKPVNDPEIGLRCGNNVAGDHRPVDLKRRAHTVEADEQLIVVHLEVLGTNRFARHPIFFGGRLWCVRKAIDRGSKEGTYVKNSTRGGLGGRGPGLLIAGLRVQLSLRKSSR